MATSSGDRNIKYREKLRSMGLVPKEVWILPKNSERLKKFEKKLQKP